MSIEQSAFRRDSLCFARGSAEPAVSAEKLIAAIEPGDVEAFRPLLPVGYSAGVQAYQSAVSMLTPHQLTTHYTSGLDFFHEEFVPQLKHKLEVLSGGVWSLDDYVAVAAGSDADLMAHLIEAVAAREKVSLFPGDWYGFRVGCSQTDAIVWDASGQGALACLCVPSVRNGHITEPMLQFLKNSESCLLNLNLFPTLAPLDRELISRDLMPVMSKSLLSISFSRGFGLTASQLGVMLVHKSHPYCKRFQQQWNWFTYFYNAIAARAFLDFDLNAAQEVDRVRSQWVQSWLSERELPVVNSGSYYVKSFQIHEDLPDYLSPLRRDNLIRLCFKPPQT